MRFATCQPMCKTNKYHRPASNICSPQISSPPLSLILFTVAFSFSLIIVINHYHYHYHYPMIIMTFTLT